MEAHRCVLNLLLLICTLCTSHVHSLTFELPDKVQSCFHEVFTDYKNYIMEYSVLKGGALDVDVHIKSPGGKTIYSKRKQQDDSFIFPTTPGTFTFCFGNQFSTITHKVVYWSLKSQEQQTLQAEAGGQYHDANTQMEESLEHLHRVLSNVVRYQLLYRHNEARGRFRAEELSLHIQWWSIGESLLILVSSVGQIVMLKAFFTSKRTI